MMCRFKNKGLVRRNLRDFLKIPVEPASRCGAGRSPGSQTESDTGLNNGFSLQRCERAQMALAGRSVRLAGEQRIQAVEFVQVLWPPRATQFFE